MLVWQHIRLSEQVHLTDTLCMLLGYEVVEKKTASRVTGSWCAGYFLYWSELQIIVVFKNVFCGLQMAVFTRVPYMVLVPLGKMAVTLTAAALMARLASISVLPSEFCHQRTVRQPPMEDCCSDHFSWPELFHLCHWTVTAYVKVITIGAN